MLPGETTAASRTPCGQARSRRTICPDDFVADANAAETLAGSGCGRLSDRIRLSVSRDRSLRDITGGLTADHLTGLCASGRANAGASPSAGCGSVFHAEVARPRDERTRR